MPGPNLRRLRRPGPNTTPLARFTETIDADGRATFILDDGIGQETGENWYTTTTTTGTAAETLGSA